MTEQQGIEQNGEMIAGKNPVLEALRSGREINKVWIAEGVKKSGINEVIRFSSRAWCPCTICTERKR